MENTVLSIKFRSAESAARALNSEISKGLSHTLWDYDIKYSDDGWFVVKSEEWNSYTGLLRALYYVHCYSSTQNVPQANKLKQMKLVISSQKGTLFLSTLGEEKFNELYMEHSETRDYHSSQ